MSEQSQAFLVTLRTIFGGDGIGELMAAWHVGSLNGWAETAMIGTGGVALGGLFMALALRTVAPA